MFNAIIRYRCTGKDIQKSSPPAAICLLLLSAHSNANLPSGTQRFLIEIKSQHTRSGHSIHFDKSTNFEDIVLLAELRGRGDSDVIEIDPYLAEDLGLAENTLVGATVKAYWPSIHQALRAHFTVHGIEGDATYGSILQEASVVEERLLRQVCVLNVSRKVSFVLPDSHRRVSFRVEQIETQTTAAASFAVLCSGTEIVITRDNRSSPKARRLNAIRKNDYTASYTAFFRHSVPACSALFSPTNYDEWLRRSQMLAGASVEHHFLYLWVTLKNEDLEEIYGAVMHFKKCNSVPQSAVYLNGNFSTLNYSNGPVKAAVRVLQESPIVRLNLTMSLIVTPSPRRSDYWDYRTTHPIQYETSAAQLSAMNLVSSALESAIFEDENEPLLGNGQLLPVVLPELTAASTAFATVGYLCFTLGSLGKLSNPSISVPLLPWRWLRRIDSPNIVLDLIGDRSRSLMPPTSFYLPGKKALIENFENYACHVFVVEPKDMPSPCVPNPFWLSTSHGSTMNFPTSIMTKISADLKSCPDRTLWFGPSDSGRTSLLKKALRTCEADVNVLWLACNQLLAMHTANGLHGLLRQTVTKASSFAPAMIVIDDLELYYTLYAIVRSQDLLCPLEGDKNSKLLSKEIAHILQPLNNILTGVKILGISQAPKTHLALEIRHLFDSEISFPEWTLTELDELIDMVIEEFAEKHSTTRPPPGQMIVPEQLQRTPLGTILRAVRTFLQDHLWHRGKAPSCGPYTALLENLTGDTNSVQQPFIGLLDVQRSLRRTLRGPSLLPKTYATIQKWGLSPDSGYVLVVGPPGCGKTMLVHHVLRSCHLKQIMVKGPELLGKYVGETESAIRELFERAMAQLPCAIFFDEIDALFPRRGSSGVMDRAVNQILCLLDGVNTPLLPGKRPFVLATTSHPDAIDAALLRAGRFDQVFFCGLPSSEQRKNILKKAIDYFFSEECTAQELHGAQELIARSDGLSPFLSGADLYGCAVTTKILFKREDGQKTLKGCLEVALGEVQPSMRREDIIRSYTSFLPYVSPEAQKEIRSFLKQYCNVEKPKTEAELGTEVTLM